MNQLNQFMGRLRYIVPRIVGVFALATGVMALLVVAVRVSEEDPFILRGIAVAPAVLAVICAMLGTLTFIGSAFIREELRFAEHEFIARRIEEERRVIEEYLQTQQRHERIDQVE